jgi:6-phosphogluconolactonase
MLTKGFLNVSTLLALGSIAALASLLISCGSGTAPIVCALPSAAGSSTCTCGGTGNAACPVQQIEYLYTSGGSGQILAFNIDTSTGALGSPIATLTGPDSMGLALVADQFVYISDPFHAEIDGFSFNQSGTLNTVPGSPFAVGHPSIPQGLASPTNGLDLLYAADDGAVDAFSISDSGVPTAIAGSPFPSGTNLYVTTDPDGQFVFTSVDDPPGGVFGFTIDSTGGLTEIAGSPFAIPGQTVANSQPSGIVANEANVYVALTGSNQIAAFSIAAGTGALTPVANSPFPAGDEPTALLLTGNFLYAINSIDATISGYSVDSPTGALTALANSPFSIAATAFAADPFGRFLYVSGPTGIQAFTIDSTTGDLTPVAGSPFAASNVLSLIVVNE